jgi:DNA replication protein DnaD
MANNNGWIKLYRKSVENPLYFSEPFDKWHAWTDLLLMVNHERKQFISKGQLLTLEPGQTVTSIPQLAERWGWSDNKVRRYLRLLNGSGMCNSSGTPNGTIITVVNWAKYQCEEQTDGRGNGRANGSTDGRADGTLTRNKEYKEYNNTRRSAKRQTDDEMWEGFLQMVKEQEEKEKHDNSGV